MNIKLKNKAEQDVTLTYKNNIFTLTRQGQKNNDVNTFYWFQKNELKKELAKCKLDSKDLKKTKEDIDNMNIKVIKTLEEFEKIQENLINYPKYVKFNIDVKDDDGDYIKAYDVMEITSVENDLVVFDNEFFLNRATFDNLLKHGHAEECEANEGLTENFPKTITVTGNIVDENRQQIPMDTILKITYEDNIKVVFDNKYVVTRSNFQWYIDNGKIEVDGYGEANESNDEFNEGPQPGDPEYHYPGPNTKITGIGKFNNIEWKMLHDTLLANMEPETVFKYNQYDIINDEEGLLTKEEFNLLLENDIIDIEKLLPIITNTDYLNYDNFYNACQNLWPKFANENNNPLNLLTIFDINKLDEFERMIYDDLIKNMSKEEVLKKIIDNANGDLTALSTDLAEVVEQLNGMNENNGWNVEDDNAYFVKGDEVTTGTGIKGFIQDVYLDDNYADVVITYNNGNVNPYVAQYDLDFLIKLNDDDDITEKIDYDKNTTTENINGQELKIQWNGYIENPDENEEWTIEVDGIDQNSKLYTGIGTFKNDGTHTGLLINVKNIKEQ